MEQRIVDLLVTSRRTVLEPQVKALEEMFFSSTYGGSEPGTLGATNVSPVQDQMDQYLMDIKDGIVQQYEIDPEAAFDFVFEVADKLAEEGQLPPMPDDPDGEEAVTEWLAAARSMGFAAYVMDVAEKEAAGGGEGDEEIETAGENGENGENGEGNEDDEMEDQFESLKTFLRGEGYSIAEDIEPAVLFKQIAQTPELAWLQEDADFKRLEEGAGMEKAKKWLS